ncbi:MAG: CHC2 zinc finger domain-containing protein [Nitrospiraceae bacterium]|nr:CHC2 zinc finger domain-containing protein [Nitrospiraceae bacterium]
MIEQKPDIVSSLQAEGVYLKQRGRSFWGLCPFHSEKTASLKVDNDRQTFYCFGCGAHGDVIDFQMRRHSIDFNEALSYLGLTPSSLDAGARQRIEREKRKRQAIAAFRAWCADEYNELADLYRKLQQAKTFCKSWADVERIAVFYHDESIWQLHMEILTGRDDQAKFGLYQVTRNAA